MTRSAAPRQGTRAQQGKRPCEVCGVVHDNGSRVEREHQEILARRGVGVGGHLDGVLPNLQPPTTRQDESFYANAVIYPENDPWADQRTADNAYPYLSAEEVQQYPELPFYFDKRGNNVVRRQPLVVDENGEIDYSVTDDNREAIRRIARQRYGVPGWAQFESQGRVKPLAIAGVSEDGSPSVRIAGDANELLSPVSRMPERNLYYVSPDGGEAIAIDRTNVPIGTFMEAGASIGMVSTGADGIPRLHHLGPVSAYGRIEEGWNYARSQVNSQGQVVRCNYCGENHYPDSAVRIQHQLLWDRWSPEPIRQHVAEYEADLNEQIVDDLRMQANLAERVEEQLEPTADPVAEDQTSDESSAPATSDDNPPPVNTLTPEQIQQVVEKVIAELGITFANNPNAKSKGTNPGAGGKVYGMLGDESDDDNNPLYTGGATGPKRKYGKPMGVDAPGLPGNIGSVHVPSLIAMAINRPGSSSAFNGCIGDISTPINKAERKQSLRLATDWYTNELLRNRGVRPGTWAARRVLRRNRDKIESFRNQASDRILTAQHMRKKFAQDPEKYAPGSPGYIAELKRDSDARAQRRAQVDSGAPVGRVDFAVGMVNAVRGQGVRGAFRFYRRFRRARKVDRAIARRRKLAERRAQRERGAQRARPTSPPRDPRTRRDPRLYR